MNDDGCMVMCGVTCSVVETVYFASLSPVISNVSRDDSCELNKVRNHNSQRDWKIKNRLKKRRASERERARERKKE
jgi:hypothetical protein